MVTLCVWKWDLGGWALRDPAAKVVPRSAILHFGPYWARRRVEEARSIVWLYQALLPIRLSWLYFKINFQATKPQLFYIKVQLGSGWGSVALWKTSCVGRLIAYDNDPQCWNLRNMEYSSLPLLSGQLWAGVVEPFKFNDLTRIIINSYLKSLSCVQIVRIR